MSIIRIINYVTYTPQQYTEIFHLVFLRHLESKLAKNLYALKGGCNLRFFFKSIRYSEDIDFDVKTVAIETLRAKVSKILRSPPFEQTLRSHDIEISHLSESKQTGTTQRWKLGLRVRGSTIALPTKIEFSRRKMEGKIVFEPVDPDLIRSYHLYPVMTNHYDLETAFRQKIDALILRTGLQTRDIFDLKLLLERGADLKLISPYISKKIDLAIERIDECHFSDFKGQVVAYLAFDYQNYYDSPKIWQSIQYTLINSLKTLKK